MNTATQHSPSLSQIEYSISEALVQKENTRLEISNGRLGNYSVQIEQYADLTVRHSQYHLGDSPIHLSARRDEPSLLMYFLLQGKVNMSTKSWQNCFETRQQLISFFPYCHSFAQLASRATVQDMAIEINPHQIHDLLLENDSRVSDFIHRKLVREESLPRQKGNFFMDATTYETLQSIRSCPYQGKMRELYLEAQTKLLLLHQLTLLTEAALDTNFSAETKLNKADIERLQELRLYLEDHFLEEHSLQSLARQFGLNLFKLKYGFKKLFGTSVMKYTDAQKLQHAKTLLLDDDRAIADIADMLGYQHANNFSIAFKRKFGYPPQVFRTQPPDRKKSAVLALN